MSKEEKQLQCQVIPGMCTAGKPLIKLTRWVDYLNDFTAQDLYFLMF